MEDERLIHYIRELGPGQFALFFYLKTLCRTGPRVFRISEITEDLDYSKPIVIEHLKQLKSRGVVNIEIRVESGKRTLFLGVTGKEILPLSSIVYTPNSINSSRRFKPNKRYKDLYLEIINKALTFPRFNNDYYKNRKYKYGEKEETHIQRLTENLKDVWAYVDWWVKHKASRMPGLSIGMIACLPMVEEYKIKNHIPIFDRSRTKSTGTRDEMAREIVREANAGKKLTDIDVQFVEKMVAAGVVEKRGEKYHMAEA